MKKNFVERSIIYIHYHIILLLGAIAYYYVDNNNQASRPVFVKIEKSRCKNRRYTIVTMSVNTPYEDKMKKAMEKATEEELKVKNRFNSADCDGKEEKHPYFRPMIFGLGHKIIRALWWSSPTLLFIDGRVLIFTSNEKIRLLIKRNLGITNTGEFGVFIKFLDEEYSMRAQKDGAKFEITISGKISGTSDVITISSGIAQYQHHENMECGFPNCFINNDRRISVWSYGIQSGYDLKTIYDVEVYVRLYH